MSLLKPSFINQRFVIDDKESTQNMQILDHKDKVKVMDKFFGYGQNDTVSKLYEFVFSQKLPEHFKVFDLPRPKPQKTSLTMNTDATPLEVNRRLVRKQRSPPGSSMGKIGDSTSIPINLMNENIFRMPPE